MTEPTSAQTPGSRSLAVLAVPVLVVVLLLVVAFSLGYVEIGLLLLLVLPFAVSALSFYVWARLRGDLD